MVIRFPRKKRPTPDELQATYEHRYRADAWRALVFALLVPAIGFVPLFGGLMGDINPAEIDYTKVAAIYGIVAAGIFLALCGPPPRRGEGARTRAVLDGAADRHGVEQ